MTGSAEDTARQLILAGVRLLQYRSKGRAARETLEVSRRVAQIAAETNAAFFVNDRPDIAHLARASGVHVGQTDLSVEEVRAVLGAEKWVGVSTHNEQQFRAAIATSADYVAVGPVFATESKENPDLVVGTEFIRRIRKLTTKPVVAIGGITLARAGDVIEAGADSVAVISDILMAKDPAARARQFLQTLQAAKPGRNH